MDFAIPKSLEDFNCYGEEYLFGYLGMEFLKVEEFWKKSKVENEFLKREVQDLKEWNRKLNNRFEAFRSEHTLEKEKLEQTVQPLDSFETIFAVSGLGLST